MKLIPLKKEQFECIKHLIAERLKESHLTDESSVDYCLSHFEAFYDQRRGGIYVDSVEDPSCFLAIVHYPSSITNAIFASISCIYIKPEKRGNPQAIHALLQAAERYARANGASAVLGSSWIYRGSEGTDLLWKKSGYEPRETTYIKHLN